MANSVDIERAVDTLRRGGVVGFPTETVYGLGADAENGRAVQRVFWIGTRPSSHPLVVHLADAALLSAWAQEVSADAWRLARRFWPGPLSLVLRRNSRIPDVVTGGRETVALRVPDHPVAIKLLRRLRGGIAAPSANRSGTASPTKAAHVVESFGEGVERVLDGGTCAVGIESTIVDLSTGRPAILRPGAVTREMLEETLGRPVPTLCGGPVPCSGQRAPQYAPRARIVIAARDDVGSRVQALTEQGLRVAVLTDANSLAIPSPVPVFRFFKAHESFARELYTTLRMIDHMHFDAVVATLPTEVGLGTAIADRLCRAAGPRSESALGWGTPCQGRRRYR